MKDIFFSLIKGLIVVSLVYIILRVIIFISLYVEFFFPLGRIAVFFLDYYGIIQILILFPLYYNSTNLQKIGFLLCVIPFFSYNTYKLYFILAHKKNNPKIDLQMQTRDTIYFIDMPSSVKNIAIKKGLNEMGTQSLFSTENDSILEIHNTLKNLGEYNFIKKGQTKELYILDSWYIVPSSFSSFYIVDNNKIFFPNSNWSMEKKTDSTIYYVIDLNRVSK
jgi:hypothetical protein